MQVIITVPDSDDLEESALPYVEEVAQQIAQGFTSGHVDRDHHWRIA